MNATANTYDVYLSLSNPPTTVTATIAAPGTVYQPSGLTAGAVYYWKVVANYGAGSSVASAIGSFTVGTAPSLSSPANGASGQSTSAQLSWTLSGATSYDVYLGTSNPPATKVTTVTAPSSGTNASYAPAGLTGGTTYYWKVVANYGSGFSAGSLVWSFITASAPPPIPPSVTLSLPGNGATGQPTLPQLVWNASTGAATYDVYLGTGTPALLTSAVAATNYTLATALNAGTQYFWNVVAKNSSGSALPSPTWSFTTAPALVLSSLTIPSSVYPGHTVSVTVTLSGPAPAGGISVSLSSTNTAFPVPSACVVAAGQSSASCSVQAAAVTTATTGSVTATYNGVSKVVQVTVVPVPKMNGLQLNPSSVGNNQSVTLTIFLTGPAPPEAATVTLSTTNATAFPVPANCVVPAAQVQASCTLTSGTFNNSGTTVTLTGSYNNTSSSIAVNLVLQNTILTVLPQFPVLGPSQSVLFTAYTTGTTNTQTATWQLTPGPVGIVGSISTPGPSTQTQYSSAPWFPGWFPFYPSFMGVMGIATANLAASSSLSVRLEAPRPSLSQPIPGNTYSTGQAVNFTMTATDVSTSPAWTNTNDYLVLRISTGGPSGTDTSEQYACVVEYQVATGQYWMRDDSGTVFTSGTLATGVSSPGSTRCSVAAGGTISRNGASITVTVPIVFKPAFAGWRLLYFSQYMNYFFGPGTLGSITLQ